jgi:pimeloyl-ACP methyl ester carboxylesterase
MPALAQRYTVIAPDLMGHGQSEGPAGDCSLGAFASNVRDLLSVLGVDRVSAVGQSFGGGVALQLAYQHPECCERLVLVDSGGLGREVSWMLRLLTLPGSEHVLPLVAPSFVRDVGNFIGRVLRERGVRMDHVAEMWAAYASLTESANREAFVRTVRAVVDPGGQSVSATDRLYLAELVPTLIMWGERDRIIPVSHAYAAHEAIPGSRLEVIEGAGHFPQVEAADRFIDILTNFIETTQPARFSVGELQHLMRHRTSG